MKYLLRPATSKMIDQLKAAHAIETSKKEGIFVLIKTSRLPIGRFIVALL